MLNVNFAAIAVLVVAAFVLSSAYYVVFGNAMAALLGTTPEQRPQPWKMLVELVRSFVLAYVLARLITLQGITELSDGLSLAFWLWLAFPVVLLSGSVIWDDVPWRLAAIHAGDWLIKVFLMSAVLTLWR